jgi:hypothetical protein
VSDYYNVMRREALTWSWDKVDVILIDAILRKHSFFDFGGTRLAYIVVTTTGAAETTLPHACGDDVVPRTPHPSSAGLGYIDAMISTLFQELVESVTNPYMDGWKYKQTNEDIGDQCEGNYGPTACDNVDSAAGEATWNVKLNDKEYLIAQVAARDGTCTTEWPLPFQPPPPPPRPPPPRPPAPPGRGFAWQHDWRRWVTTLNVTLLCPLQKGATMSSGPFAVDNKPLQGRIQMGSSESLTVNASPLSTAGGCGNISIDLTSGEVL